MAETLPAIVNDEETEASVVRRAFAALLGAPLGSFTTDIQKTTAGGGHGVVDDGDLVVSQHAGTPGMSVDVAVGTAVVRGTEASDAGCYVMANTTVKQLTIAAANPSQARKDLIVAKVNDNEYDSGGVGSFELQVVTGTPSGSPADPTVPTNSLVLARVNVAAAATSILNGNITDLRTWTTALGGIHRCLSTARPLTASLKKGLMIFERDTGLVSQYDGASWAPLFKLTGSGAVELQSVTVARAKGKRYTANISGSVTIDPANGPDQTLTLTGNVTALAVTGLADGESIEVELIENGTGGWTIASAFSGAGWTWVNGVAAATALFNTGANKAYVLVLHKKGSAIRADLAGPYS